MDDNKLNTNQESPTDTFDAEPSTHTQMPLPVGEVSRPESTTPAILPTEAVHVTKPTPEPQLDPSIFDTKPFVQPKKSKKPLIIGGIITAVAFVLVGGSALAYNFWYQNPDKVIVDAIINATKAKTTVFNGLVDISGSQKVKIEFDGQAKGSNGLMNAKATFDVSGKSVTVEGSALIDKGSDLFLKVKNLKALMDQSLGNSAGYATAFDPIIKKIDNKWVKITTDDIASYSEGAKKAKQCIDDVYVKFKDDKAAIAEVTDVFQKNRFIVVGKELPSQNDSLGLEIKIDNAKYESFAKAFVDTKIYKQLQSCDKDSFGAYSAPTSATTDSKSKDPIVVLWISRWGHDITKVTSDIDQNGAKAHLDLSTTFNKVFTVDAPKDFVTLEQLKSDIGALFGIPPPAAEPLPSKPTNDQAY